MSLEKQLFGVIKFNIYISLQRPLYKGQSNTIIPSFAIICIIIYKTKLKVSQMLVRLNQAKKFILAVTFKIRDRNPGVCLELMICTLKMN